MDLGLKGKIAIVTGGSRGVGRACAASLLREGARVMITARDPKRLQATRDALAKETGGEVQAIAADLESDAETKAMVEATLKAFGGLDILVNCAATVIPDNILVNAVVPHIINTDRQDATMRARCSRAGVSRSTAR